MTDHRYRETHLNDIPLSPFPFPSGPFIAGLVFQQLTAEIGKHIIGRLRPHFLQLCQPEFLLDGDMKTCLDLEKPWNHYIVVDRDNETAFRSAMMGKGSPWGVWSLWAS